MNKSPKLIILEKYKQNLEIMKRELEAKLAEVDEMKEEIKILEILVNQ